MTGTNAMELGMGLEPTTCALRMRNENVFKRFSYAGCQLVLTPI